MSRKKPAPNQARTRPTKFTPHLGAEIVRRYSAGETIKSICQDPDMPSRGGVYFWLSDASDNRTPEFVGWQNAMAIARTAHAYALADDCLDIADDDSNDTITGTRRDGTEYNTINSEWVARSKLRVDTRLKLVEKLAPEQFGNSLALTGANGGAIQI